MLKELKKLIPVPANPIDVDESLLVRTQKELNVTFPKDYLEYAKVYGSGTIVAKDAYSWEIISPFRANFPGFVRAFYETQDEYRRDTENNDVPLGLFPEPGGLLPFGHRDDIYLTWRTKGKPNEWSVVVIWQYQQDGYEEFAASFSGFLVDLLNRKIAVAPWPAPWDPQSDITFKTTVYGA